MRKMKYVLLLLSVILFCGCGRQPKTEVVMEKETETDLIMTIDGTQTPVQWEDNEAVAALIKYVEEKPLTIEMSMYGGFEQVGALGTDLPRNDAQTTTGPGDIVLYSGDQIVVFYGSNSWAYTRLGKIKDLSEEKLKELLGDHDVKITLEMK